MYTHDIICSNVFFVLFLHIPNRLIWMACVGQRLACSWLFNLSTASLLLYRNVNKEITEERCVVIKVYKVQRLRLAGNGSIFNDFSSGFQKTRHFCAPVVTLSRAAAPIGLLEARNFRSCSLWPASTGLPYNLHCPQFRSLLPWRWM